MTVLTIQNGLEALDCVFQGHQLAHVSSEDLSDLEGLGQKPLDLTCTSHCELILLRQLIHTQNSNDILQGLVVLNTEKSRNKVMDWNSNWSEVLR